MLLHAHAGNLPLAWTLRAGQPLDAKLQRRIRLANEP
jgi:hypothetical protein